MPARSYRQYCALAKSLDVVGDRWTLLIVRELLEGPQRYGDLLTALAPIATDMLASRLRDLEAHGLLRKYRMPKPASVTVYELTDVGCSLEDVVNAFARWGRPLMETRAPGDALHPQWLARAVRAYIREDRDGPPVTFRLVTPEGTVTLTVDPDGVEAVGEDRPAAVTLRGTGETLFAAMDSAQLPELVATGALHVDGEPDAVRQVAGLFA